MKTNSLFRISALLAVLAMAIPAIAKPVSKDFLLTQTAKVGKATLNAGTYHIVIHGTMATINKNGKKVAESEGHWVTRDSKSQYDSVLVGDDGQVREVRISGKSQVFVFSE